MVRCNPTLWGRAECVLVMFVIAALTGCSGAGVPTRVSVEQSTQLPAPEAVAPPQSIYDALPPLPVDAPPRSTSIPQTDTVFGADFFQASPAVQTQGSSAIIPAGPGAIQWAIYRYNLGPATPLSFTFSLTAPAGGKVYVALANYGTMRWDFRGPFPEDTGQRGFADLDQGNFASPGGFLYVAAIAFDNTNSTVQFVQITTEVQQELFSISGQVTRQDNGQGLGGVTLVLTPGGNQTVTTSTGNYAFGNLGAGTYTVTPSLDTFTFDPVSQQATIGPDATGVNFVGAGQQQLVTYNNTMKALMDTYCITCHGPSIQQGGRRFDTYAHATSGDSAERAKFRVWDQRESPGLRMPPPGNPQPNLTERQKFEQWLLDGKLEN